MNLDTGNQITTYTYDVTLANSEIASDDMLRKVTYPDAGEVFYEYNRQGQQTKFTDENGSVHVYEYDGLGRLTNDRATPGSGIDTSVQRIERTYDERMRLEHVTSYTLPTGGSAVSDISFENYSSSPAYNGYGQVLIEHQEHGAMASTSSPKVLFAKLL